MTSRSDAGSTVFSPAKIIIASVSFLLAASCGMAAWEMQSARDERGRHETRITAIEANQYTAKDALNDYKEFTRAIDSLRSEQRQGLDNLRQWIEDSFPPDYLKDDVNELKSDVRELREELRHHFAAERNATIPPGG